MQTDDNQLSIVEDEAVATHQWYPINAAIAEDLEQGQESCSTVDHVLANLKLDVGVLAQDHGGPLLGWPCSGTVRCVLCCGISDNFISSALDTDDYFLLVCSPPQIVYTCMWFRQGRLQGMHEVLTRISSKD